MLQAVSEAEEGSAGEEEQDRTTDVSLVTATVTLRATVAGQGQAGPDLVLDLAVVQVLAGPVLAVAPDPAPVPDPVPSLVPGPALKTEGGGPVLETGNAGPGTDAPDPRRGKASAVVLAPSPGRSQETGSLSPGLDLEIESPDPSLVTRSLLIEDLDPSPLRTKMPSLSRGLNLDQSPSQDQGQSQDLRAQKTVTRETRTTLWRRKEKKDLDLGPDQGQSQSLAPDPGVWIEKLFPYKPTHCNATSGSFYLHHQWTFLHSKLSLQPGALAAFGVCPSHLARPSETPKGSRGGKEAIERGGHRHGHGCSQTRLGRHPGSRGRMHLRPVHGPGHEIGKAGSDCGLEFRARSRTRPARIRFSTCARGGRTGS